MPTQSAARRPSPVPLFDTQPLTNYLWIPQRLLDTHYDSPLAIGLYAAIARRWLADGDDATGVSISDRDLIRFDPTLSRGAISRALRRLVAAGWLWADRRQGCKTRYIPAWGRTRSGGLRCWARGKPGLNRGTTPTIRMSRTLLDAYVGRLIPHARDKAQVERFTTTPQLSLRDIGMHLLQAHSRTEATTAALDQTGLSMNGLALSVPDLATAVAPAELSIQGMQHLGMVPHGPILATPPAVDTRPTIYQIPPNWLGQWLGQWPGLQRTDQRTFSPLERHETAAAVVSAKRTGMVGMTGIDLTPPSPPYSGGGGMRIMSNRNGSVSNEGEEPATTPEKPAGGFVKNNTKLVIIPDTPTAHLLRRLNVRPAQIRELADVPLATAEAALADAQARDDITSIPAWVVSLLRDAQEHGFQPGGDPATTASPLMASPFTAQIAAQSVPDAVRPDPLTPDLWAALPGWFQALLDGATVTPDGVQARAAWQQDELARRAAGLVAALLPALAAGDQVLAFERALLAPADPEPVPAAPVIPMRATPPAVPAHHPRATSPASSADHPRATPPVPSAPRPILAPPTPAAAAAVLPPPPWVRRPDQWPCLPRVIQAALASSTEQDGAIIGANAFLTKQIAGRYGREIAALRGEEDA